MTGSYNIWLVGLSIAIAITASWSALDLAARPRVAQGRAAILWLLGGAVSMGVGVWSMHFIGMLAFSLPIPLAYDIPITLGSIVPAVLAAAMALLIMRRASIGGGALFASSCLIGFGIVGMHYTGMAALKMLPVIRYDPALFATSVLIAIGASWVALRLVLIFRSAGQSEPSVGYRLTAAVVMGLAIAGMHYTGMAAAMFDPQSVCTAAPKGVDPTQLAIIVATGAILIFLFTIAIAAFDTVLQQRANVLAEVMVRELYASRAQLAAIVDSSNDAIISRNLDRKIVSWNIAAERLFGYTAAEASGQSVSIIIPSDRAEEAANNRALLAQGYAVLDLETVRITKDGRRIDVSLSQSPINDESGVMTGVSLIFRDISERKRAEETRARLAAIVENANDAIVSRALDGTILSWNAAAERMFGFSLSDVIGRPITILFPPGWPAILDQNTSKVLRGGVIVPYETQLVTKDGRIIDVLASLSPIKNSAGDVIAISVILRDISALKKAAATIRESEERFRAAFEQAEVGMALRGVDPGNTRWLRVNQKLCNILGYTREELLQLTTLDVTPPAEREVAIDFSTRLMRGEITTYTREKRYVRKDGQIIWANITLSAVCGPDGRPTHAISVVQDISERKVAEQQLREYLQRLRLLSRRLFDVEENARRGLARELHDRLGQNVTALMLNLNMIRGDLPEDSLRKVAARMDDSDALLTTSGQLIRDVMADLRPPGLDELGLLPALNYHAREVASRSAFVVAVKGDPMAPRLSSDTETTLFRIAQEALINVAKHAQASEVVITLETGPELVVLRIADNGCGYHLSTQHAQVTASLGMVNMRERAESIGAELRVESTPGQGARVIIEVPCAVRAAYSEPQLPGMDGK